MDLPPEKLTADAAGRCRRPRLAAAGWAAVLTLAAGCVSTGNLIPVGGEAPPTGPVCQVVATWTHEVRFTPDPANNGASTPGLVGRLYLFGPEVGYPLAGDGALTVDLYDDTALDKGGKSALLEQWRIDKDTLQRLLRRDTIGWGYTLFLPWGTYKPEIAVVHLKLRYEPLHGNPLYTDSGPLTLNGQQRSAAARPAIQSGKPRD